jgi:IRX15/IRX15L/GXM
VKKRGIIFGVPFFPAGFFLSKDDLSRIFRPLFRGKLIEVPANSCKISFMKKAVEKYLSFLHRVLRIELTRICPSDSNISKMRELNEIQLSSEQLQVIIKAVKSTPSCRLLVFGLGNDSMFWSKLNRGGLTVFLEDNKDWLEKITRRSKRITAFLVHYNTQRKDWKKLLESPSLLNMSLPNEVKREKWDVILVDGPEGWKDFHPGRMKSIYLSSRLIKDPGHIFVHDCDREIEDAYCNHFLKKKNMKMEIAGLRGVLRHYKMTGPAT